MFLVVPQSDVHFAFDHPFFACPIWRAILLEKSAPRKKFAQPCNFYTLSEKFFSACLFEIDQVLLKSSDYDVLLSV